MRLAIYDSVSLIITTRIVVVTYLAKTFGLSVLFKTESREMNSRAEDLCFCQDTDTTDTVDLHLHVWVTVGVAEISQMRSPGSVLCVSFDNDSIFIECIGQRKGSL